MALHKSHLAEALSDADISHRVKRKFFICSVCIKPIQSHIIYKHNAISPSPLASLWLSGPLRTPRRVLRRRRAVATILDQVRTRRLVRLAIRDERAIRCRNVESKLRVTARVRPQDTQRNILTLCVISLIGNGPGPAEAAQVVLLDVGVGTGIRRDGAGAQPQECNVVGDGETEGESAGLFGEEVAAVVDGGLLQICPLHPVDLPGRCPAIGGVEVDLQVASDAGGLRGDGLEGSGAEGRVGWVIAACTALVWIRLDGVLDAVVAAFGGCGLDNEDGSGGSVDRRLSYRSSGGAAGSCRSVECL